MLAFEIVPHIGIGPITLGSSRSAIRTALAQIGLPLEHTNSTRALDYSSNSAIQIGFDADDTSSFIGVAYSKAYNLTYFGVNAFDVAAEEFFAFVSARDDSGEHVFDQSGYLFPNQILTLWEADEQYDNIGGQQRVMWAQVGLGDERYLRCVNKHS